MKHFIHFLLTENVTKNATEKMPNDAEPSNSFPS